MAHELIGSGNPDACGMFVDPRRRGGDISVRAWNYARGVPSGLSGGEEVDVLGGAEAAFGQGEVVDPGGVVAEQFAADGVYGYRVERGEDQAEVLFAAGEVAALQGYRGINHG